MSIFFPAYVEDEEAVDEQPRENETPREYGVDFATGQLTGEVVEGLEAVRVWIWMALRVPRYRYYAYSWDYGNEVEDLIGLGYTEEYIDAEARRMVEECLSVNENIESVSDFQISMDDDRLNISFRANTIYGSLEMTGLTLAGTEGKKHV